MAKDETMVGITGLPIPKKKMSPAKQHEFEKKRRANIGTNVGGEKYGKDVNPGYNPRARTFEEFMSVAEAKVDAGLSDTEKKEVRTARSGLTGQYANNERRGAHRENDELNKDAKDIRKGKLGGPQFQGKTGAERIAQVKKAKGM